MSYGKKYTATIASRENETLQADIYVKDYSGSVTELTLAWSKPITIEYDMEDGVFKPLKMSGCTLSVLTDEPLFDLYSGTLNSVQLKVYRDGTMIWFGFLTPCVYSSEYATCQDQLDLEFVDPLSAMENVKFGKFDDEFFATFEEYIQQALSCVGADSDITAISGMPTDLASVGCMQRNYIDETDDEDDGAMTWQEVMESILRYMNKTAYIYGNTFYIYDAADKDRIENPKSLATIGIAEGNGSISLGEVYNKVTVLANNNPIDTTIPDILDDSALSTDGIMESGTYEITTEYTNPTRKTEDEEKELSDPGVYVLCNAFFLNSNWKLANDLVSTAGAITADSISSSRNRSFIQKYFEYKKNEGEPSSRNWSTVLTFGFAQTADTIITTDYTTIYYGDRDEPYNLWGVKCYAELVNKPMFIGKGGVLIISMSYMLSNIAVFGNSAPYSYTPETYGEALAYSNTDRTATFRDDKFKVQLAIGSKYYNGESWQDTECSFYITHRNVSGDQIFGIKKSIDNTVSYQWNLGDSKDGYAVKLPDDEVLHGRISFKIWPDSRIGGLAQKAEHVITAQDQGYDKYSGNVYNTSPILAIHIDSLSLTYTTSDTVEDIYNLTDYDADITYTGNLDEDNIAEADDVEFTTNTYTSRAVSYSYAIKLSNGKYTYVTPDTIPEQTCISRLVNYYSQARMQYQNTINDKKGAHITPTDNITIPAFSDRIFTIGSVTFNLSENSADVTLLEL